MHWGTAPGLNFIYAHLNRAIRAHDVSVLYVAGPGHGGPGMVACAYLDGTYSEVYPAIGQDEGGMRRLFRQFSFPGGIPSHVAPETPGSIHEGGELGYSLSHAFGAAFDNPDLIVACVVGDGEAETGPPCWRASTPSSAARARIIDHVLNKKAEIVRVYLPPDANTLLAVTEHCLRSRNLVNVIVAGKQPEEQWLDMATVAAHCRRGIGVWAWASSAGASDADVDAVLACAGDVPTLEALAAAQLLYEQFPMLRLRVVNVVDLMTLQPPHAHPHGLPERDFDALFTAGKPVVFAYHGYPSLIHRLTYRRGNHDNIHVHGFREEGTTTTPFDMAVLNQIDRFRLFAAIVERVPKLAPFRVGARQFVADKLDAHRRQVEEHGIDLPEILDWRWRGPDTTAVADDGAT